MVAAHVLGLNVSNKAPFEMWAKMLEVIALDALRGFRKGQALQREPFVGGNQEQLSAVAPFYTVIALLDLAAPGSLGILREGLRAGLSALSHALPFKDATGAPAVNARQEFESVRSSRAVDDISAAPAESLNPTAANRVEGCPVVRSPKQLRLHRALDELGCIGAVDDLNYARQTNQSVLEPILITTNGTILAGLGHWRAAVFDGRHEINCIEYPPTSQY